MRLAVLLVALVSLRAAASNPVLPGDHPDPSVIRTSKGYWATATTSRWAPIFPILHSSDLIHWRTAGAVFQERPDWAETNFWAPEIAEHKGRYFVYYTAKKKDGPLCVAVATATQPAGPYTDHGPLVCQEAGSIDAQPATDEHGQRYLIWKEDGNSRKQPTPLWAQPLDESGTKLTGEPRELFRNDASWEGQLVEGPFVLRRAEWFYLFYSAAGCCGRGCNYALGVARAKSLLGPWEKNPGNPILAGNDMWKCPGHGSVVEDRRGRTFLLYHAYDPQESIFVGRQGMLDEIAWDSEGWPSINGGKGPSSGPRPRGVTFAEEFSGTPSPLLEWPVNQAAKMDTASGWLDLEGVLAKAPTAMDYFARTVVEGSGGIAAWGDARNATGLTLSGGKLTLWRRDKGDEAVLATAETTAQRVHLRFQSTGGNRFAFSYSEDGQKWTDLEPSVDGDHLPPWDLAVRIALVGPGRFDFLRTRDARGQAAVSAAAANATTRAPAKRKSKARRRR
ncbi:MAG TPA: glycoside hydrolase family 43 protein [Bryobacteraceae bacterium]|nr:glycoside hydrolase family 43 protein [Bryobacteraceae bacterium]